MRRAVALALCCAAGLAPAAEFRSVAVPAAILHDAPSAKATRLFILGRGYPLEVIIVLGDWAKVRDAAGLLAWVQTGDLSTARMVLAVAEPTLVRVAPREGAEIAFAVDREVLLELLGREGPWARVRHPDGSTGYVHMSQAWGL